MTPEERNICEEILEAMMDIARDCFEKIPNCIQSDLKCYTLLIQSYRNTEFVDNEWKVSHTHHWLDKERLHYHKTGDYVDENGKLHKGSREGKKDWNDAISHIYHYVFEMDVHRYKDDMSPEIAKVMFSVGTGKKTYDDHQGRKNYEAEFRWDGSNIKFHFQETDYFHEHAKDDPEADRYQKMICGSDILSVDFKSFRGSFLGRDLNIAESFQEFLKIKQLT